MLHILLINLFMLQTVQSFIEQKSHFEVELLTYRCRDWSSGVMFTAVFVLLRTMDELHRLNTFLLRYSNPACWNWKQEQVFLSCVESEILQFLLILLKVSKWLLNFSPRSHPDFWLDKESRWVDLWPFLFGAENHYLSLFFFCFSGKKLSHVHSLISFLHLVSRSKRLWWVAAADM